MRVRPPVPIGDRPMGVVDILDGSFAALRQRPRTMVAIVGVLLLPGALLEGWIARTTLASATFDDLLDDPTRWSNSGADVGLFSTESMVLVGVEWLTLAVAGVPIARVVGGWLNGHDVGPVEALRFGARRGATILAAFVLIHAIELVAAIALLVPGFIAMLWFSLTSPVIALEERGPWESMKRSVRLVRKNGNQVFGVVVLVGAVSFAIELVIGTLPSAATSILGPDRAWPIVSVATYVSRMLLVPFTAAAMALAYLDARFRHEGLDIALRSRETFAAEVID